MDQPFAGARATDTASEAPKSSYDPTQAADTPRHRRREQTSGRRAQAYLADNTPVPVRYRVMDLDELTPSNDPDGAVNPAFPAELQPRDRTGKNSQVQVRNIAARLNPERLAESMDAGSGSPIVGPDGVVESGNGRTMAIAQAYRSGSPQARRYRQFVQQRAQDFGIDPEVVNGMRNPVLVRERTGSIDRAEFARRANEADVASMTPFETAVADADRLSAEDMAEWTTDESGDPLAASNRAFTRRFAQRLGNNEASRYRGRDGMPSAELGERMLRAVFAKGYADEQGRPSPDMLEMVTERQGSLRNLTLALQSAAPDFAVARDYGGEQAAAMIDTVVDAVRVVRQARTSGVAVRELVGQNDAFAQAVPRDTAALAMFMANNARSRRGLADSLAMIAAATRRRAESQRNGALFDDPVSNEDITHAATRQDPLATDDGQPGGGGDATRGDRTGSGETASGQEADRAQAPSEEPGLDDSLLSTYDEQELVDRDSERTAPRAGGRDATLEEEHTPASERRAAEIAQQMSPGEIRAELDALTSRLDERYNQGMRGAGSNIYLPRTHFATDDELARRNDLMQALPSQSQQRAEARQRIEQRARDRAASRASTNATDSNGAESSRESGRERPSTNAPITWQRRGKSRVWDGSNGNLIVDHGFQVGGERIPMLMVFKDQQAYQRGDNFATGNSVREAKQLAQDHASQALSEPAGSDQSRRESDRAQAGIPGRRQPDNEIPTARRRNKPLEYTGYSGQSRSARSYTEVGQYRIAKVHDGLYEVIDASGQAVSQLAGPNGALQEAQRLIERGGVTDHGEQMYAKRESSGDRQGWEPPSVDQVIDALEGMRDQLGDISVIGSTSELPLASQLQMLRDGVDADEVRGLYIGDQLYLVAGNNDSLQQAIQTAVHEAVGHKGIRGVLGDEIVPVMRQLYRSLPHDKRGREALQEVLDTYTHLDRNDPDDQVAIAEEMVAHLLEKGYRPKVWQRAVAKIRELLRRLFPAMDWTYTDVLALGERSRDFLRSQATGRGDSEQRYSRRGWQDDFPNAVLAHPLRWASQHPDYEAAKAGDDRAALRLARDAVTPEFVEQVRGLIPAGSQPRIVPVLAQESAGRNRIPAMTAEVLANRLGIETVDTLAQRERVSRTGANAMERLQRQPTFDGDVTDGDYLLIDDTLTQGGTLAQLKTHIEDQGGRVLGVAALTGKQFSRKIAVDPATLDQVRDRFGSVEDQWRAAFGYGFEGLTQSEARTLLTFERGRLSPDELRDRIPALRDANVDGLGEGATGSRSGPEAPLDPSLYSLRPRREPTADQFDDLDAEQRDFMAKFGSKTATRRAMDWYRDLTRRAMLRIRQGMVDQYAALKELDEKRFGKDGALAEDITSSSWVLARMSNAASGALHAMLHNGRIYLDPDQKVIDIRDDDAKGLGAVLGQLGRPAEIERFMMWIAANRSSKLAGEGREFLFTEAEIRAGMQLNEGRLADGSSRRERYQKAFDEFQQYRDDVLAIAEQSGVIRPDQRAMWRDEFYVPFYRLKDDKDVNVQLCTSGLSRQQAYKRLKGGTDNINDLLQNTMMNFHHLLDASLKNQAAQQAMTNAEAMGIAHVVPESGRDTTKSTFVMQGGRKTFYEINDPMVFSAVSALAHPGMNNAIMKIMRGFKRVFTNMTTTTPQFIAANLMRDTLQAVATNEVSANVFKNIYDGAGTLRDQKKRARMLAAGGSFHFGHLYGNNPDELRAQLTRNLRDAKVVGVPGSRSSVVAAPAKLIRAGWAKWGDVNNFVENVNRAAIYDQNQDYGKLKAAFEARDLIDFSARGAWPAVRILTDIVPFLNARIQGLDKIYRSGIKPGANVLGAAFGKGQAGVSDKQAAARFWSVAGVTTLATIALYLNNRDDEDYQKLEDWQKDTYWFFKVGDQAFFIPKPFEVGAIATMAERITQQFVDDEATGALFAQRMGHMLTGTFAFSPVPQMMQPALDVYANRDSFTDRPIEGMGDQRLSPMLRRRDSTSRVARGTSWALNHTLGAIGNPETNPAALSPLQVDYLIQGYLGQVGAWAAGSLDVAWNVFDGKDEPAKRWYEYQPIRRFYTNLGDEPRYTRYGTVFYDGLREAERAYADVKEMGEMGRLEEARALARSKADVLKLRKPLMRAQRKLNDVRKQIEAIRRSNLDGELKRQRIDRLTALKNRIQQILGEKILEQRAGS
nr:LPD38 domain-containing protein [Salinicola sp. DM10]